MSSLQLPSVAPSKDIRHFFPNLDPEQLAAKQDKDAPQQQRDAAADVKWRAARAAAAVAAAATAAAGKKHVGRPRKEQVLQACDDAGGSAAQGDGAAGKRGPYKDWFPPELFDPIVTQVRAEQQQHVCVLSSDRACATPAAVCNCRAPACVTGGPVQEL